MGREGIGRNIHEWGDLRRIRNRNALCHRMFSSPTAACLRSFNMIETRILLAIDDSPASMRAVTYAAHLVGRRRGFRFCIVHVLPPFPPRLLEHGGTETSAKDLKAEQHLWLAAARKTYQKGLDEAGAKLRKAGVPRGAIQLLFCDLQSSLVTWHQNFPRLRARIPSLVQPAV